MFSDSMKGKVMNQHIRTCARVSSIEGIVKENQCRGFGMCIENMQSLLNTGARIYIIFEGLEKGGDHLFRMDQSCE